MTCPIYNDCPQSPTAPLLNYSSETADVNTFVGLGFGPVLPPPLGWSYTKATAFATAQSATSQADANAAAYAQAVYFAQDTWVAPGGVLPIEWGENFDWNGFIPGGLTEPPLI